MLKLKYELPVRRRTGGIWARSESTVVKLAAIRDEVAGAVEIRVVGPQSDRVVSTLVLTPKNATHLAEALADLAKWASGETDTLSAKSEDE